MLLLQHHQEGLLRRLSVIGIPTYARRPFVDLMVKWEQCSGVEWTIKRLKSLKIDLIRRKSGLPPITWVRKNRRGDVAGVLGSLFRWSEKSDRNFARSVQAFMAYTFYIHGSLTESQKQKFLSGVNPLEKEDLPESFHKDFGNFIRSMTVERRIRKDPSPLVTYQGSPSKKAPRLFGRSSVPQSEKVLDDVQFFNTDGGRYLYSMYPEIYAPLLKGCAERVQHLEQCRLGYARLAELEVEVNPPSIYGGEVHFLQEPGGKLRSIASPLRIHQEALRPLAEELYGIVRSLPWDCTFDQTKAIPYIQSHLGKGGQVHSVDLSSATDMFPVSLQDTALRAILRKEDHQHVDLFLEISRATWKSEIGSVKWTKGQPLGLYPSFASFTLTHGLLLLYLAGGDYHQQFFVVGDDVVIFERKLYDDYISMLDRMRCPWSPDKSISSDKLSEFAGKIITPTGVIPQMKWRRMSDDNFLDIARLLGRRSRCLLSERQKFVFDRVAHLCEPIGLNFSLPGDNLITMIERTQDFYQPDRAVLGSLVGLRKNLNRLVYGSSETLEAEALKEISATFDEKVKAVFEQTIFNRWEFLLQLGIDGFCSLPEALELYPRLPTRVPTSSRKSTLERYERLLRQ